MPIRHRSCHRFLTLALLCALLVPSLSCGAHICGAINPGPSVISISPANVVAGGAAFRLTIVGTNFTSSTVVTLSDGTQAQPLVISNTQMLVGINAPQIASTGILVITVIDRPRTQTCQIRTASTSSATLTITL